LGSCQNYGIRPEEFAQLPESGHGRFIQALQCESPENVKKYFGKAFA